MKYIVVSVTMAIVVIIVTSCGLLKTKPRQYNLDVKCSCPDGSSAKPLIDIPQLFIAEENDEILIAKQT